MIREVMFALLDLLLDGRDWELGGVEVLKHSDACSSQLIAGRENVFTLLRWGSFPRVMRMRVCLRLAALIPYHNATLLASSF